MIWIAAAGDDRSRDQDITDHDNRDHDITDQACDQVPVTQVIVTCH